MTVNSIKRQRKLSDWALLIEEQKSSGVTVKQWCSERHIAVSSFYAWQNKLCKTLTVAQNAAVSPNQPSFIEVTPTNNTHTCSPLIHVTHGDFNVSIGSGADPATIQAVIWALQKPC